MQFFEHLESRYNVFDEFPECDRVFEVGIMSVSSEYRGAGIAMALLKKTMELVEKMSVPLSYCICSSRFSGIICAQSGFEAVHRLPYKDYMVEGRRQIRPEEPHTEAVLYVRKM